MARRMFLKRIGFALVAVVCFFALLEGLLWVAGGVRSRWIQPRVTGGGGRTLVCVGDSVTFGLGADTDQSYPSQLARLPEIRGRDVQVVNLGRPGQSLRGAVAGLRDYLTDRPAGEGTLVLLLGGFNDCVHLPGMFTEHATVQQPAPVQAFLARFRTYRLLRNLLARVPERDSGSDTLLPPVGTGHDRDLCRNELGPGALDAALRLSAQHGFQLLVTTYPIPLRAQHSDLPTVTAAVNEILREETRRRGVPLLDTVACVQEAEQASSEPFFNDDGIHLFARGYAAMARCLARMLASFLSP